jgi:hypothetical protein
MHKGARTDPCGGRGVTRAPTATLWVKNGGSGHVHRPSGVPPTAAISLHRRELELGAITRLSHRSTVGRVDGLHWEIGGFLRKSRKPR